MTGLQLTGLASGMDTDSIITSLMAIERQPRDRMAYQEVNTEAKKTALTNIQSKLATLKLAASDLGSVATWVDTQTVTSENDAKASAVSTSGVGPGTYNFVVSQMASAERRGYTYAAPASDETWTVGSGAASAQVDVTSSDSIDDVVAKINSNSATGVFAVNVNGKLVLASRNTGSANAVSITGSSTLSEDSGSYVAGKDLLYTVDGGTQQSSGTNTVKNAVPGLDVTFKGKTDVNGVSITVGNPAPDNSALKDKIKAFVSSYNDALTTVKAAYDEQKVQSPASNDDASKGSLSGDFGLDSIMSDLRSTVASVVGGADPGMNLLSQIGISTGAASSTLNQDAIAGKLTFDESAFDTAYATNPTGVAKVLGANGTGFSAAFSSVVDNYSSVTGLLSQRMTEADSTIQTLKDSLADFDTRLDARQQFLQSQFAAMETAMQASQSMGAQLTAQLASLPLPAA